MGKRKHIGIIFSYSENWIGGAYYIINLVHALNSLPDDRKPTISIISPTKQDYNRIQDEVKYDYASYVPLRSDSTLFIKAINAISLRLLRRKIINPRLKGNYNLLFPNPTSNFFDTVDESIKLYWIPDFQEHHLPDYFSNKELILIKQRQVEYAYRANQIVFSSLDAKKDYLTLYPTSKATVSVIPFCVTHPDFSTTSFESVCTKFHISRPYFYSPNQFWMHKNHSIVIEAVKTIKQTDKDIFVLFSGKESDYRNPHYTSNLKSLVKENGLEDNIKFLGFLDRREQLSILSNAKAIIQPSLFEGWSTVIEDAKALNKFIIASNLEVHKEQLTNYKSSLLFNPHNSQELIDIILKNNTLDLFPYDYDSDRLAYAKSFLNLLESA